MRASTAADPSLESGWVAGVITVLYGALAALVAGLALAAATSWSSLGVVSSALAFGLLVGLSTRLIAGGPIHGWAGVTGRAAIAVAVGVVVGEIAALAIFAGAIDRSLDESAARSADAVPAVVEASTGLAQSRAARADLDVAIDQSRARLDETLVIARCEYNPSSECPQTRITGLPGSGPETLTANELLADARQDLDNSLGARERQAPGLDAAIVDDERTLADARAAATTTADRSLGARWVAMHDHTLAGPGALLLRLVTIAFFVLLSLLPLIRTLWRGETADERRAAAHAVREGAELKADTAIAVKRNEVRQAAEILWAEQQLASARLAVEAQHEIDRVRHRRRVAQALDGPIPVEPQREENAAPVSELGAQQVSEPKALESTMAALPAGPEGHLPARVESEVVKRAQPPLIPDLPDLTRSAVRWIRPFVPSIVAKAIDTTTHPVRTARQVFEEVEEIHFSLRRTHSVTVHSVDSAPSPHATSPQAPSSPAPELPGDDEGTLRRVESSVVRDDLVGSQADGPGGALSSRAGDVPLVAKESRGLPESAGARQLPPGK